MPEPAPVGNGRDVARPYATSILVGLNARRTDA